MHNTIYQISFEQVEAEMNIFDIPEWFYPGIADYYRPEEKNERIDSINFLAKRFGGTLLENGSIQVKKESIENIMKERFQRIKQALENLNKFCTYESYLNGEYDAAFYRLKDACEDEFDDYFYYDYGLNTLGEFLSIMNHQEGDEVTLYVGTTMDYHW